MNSKLLPLVPVLLFIIGITAVLVGGDTNLVDNPSFEGQYSAYIPPNGHPDCPAGICATAQMAPNWIPWWRSHDPSDPDYIIRMPEYKPASPIFNDPVRVRSGQAAQQYFTFFSTHEAGFLQQSAVIPGVTYRFQVWGHSWSAQDDDDAYSGPEDGLLIQKVGIDPTGGDDWQSANIIWGAERLQYDIYGLFEIAATAQAPTMTLFVYSQPAFPVKHNDVYWDDATLFVVNQGTTPPPPPPPTDTGGEQPAGGVHVVQPGETLSAIARRYGTTAQAIAAANNIANLNLIRPGQQLTIPGGGAPPGDTTDPAPPPVEGLLATTQANLRLRSGPGTNHEILEVLPFGTVVSVTGRNASSDWIQVTYQGRSGWVAAWHTAISGGSLSSAPVQP